MDFPLRSELLHRFLPKFLKTAVNAGNAWDASSGALE